MAPAKPKPSTKKAKTVKPPCTGGVVATEPAGVITTKEGKADTAEVTGIVVTSESKHGLRSHWGKHEWAQHAIMAIYHPGPVPKSVNLSALWRMVKKRLEKNPDYGHGPISRVTVMKAHHFLTLSPEEFCKIYKSDKTNS
jgi:hypothetical protein